MKRRLGAFGVQWIGCDGVEAADKPKEGTGDLDDGSEGFTQPMSMSIPESCRPAKKRGRPAKKPVASQMELL